MKTAEDILSKHKGKVGIYLIKGMIRRIDAIDAMYEYANQFKTQSVPYQTCPICKGKGHVLAKGFTNSIFTECDVCKGNKIIPMHVINNKCKRK